MKPILLTIILLMQFVPNSLPQTTVPESKTEIIAATNRAKVFKSNALNLRFEYPEELETEEWIDQVSLFRVWNKQSGSRDYVLSIVNQAKSDSYSAFMARLIYNRLKRTRKDEAINSQGLNGWVYIKGKTTRIAGYSAYQAIAVFDPSRFGNMDGRGMGSRYEWYFYFKRGKELWSVTCGATSKKDLERNIPTIETVLKSLKFDK